MRLHLALLVLVIALAPASAWLSGWSFRRPIEVNVTTNLTDYQLALNITYDSDMNSDFSDLRFIDDDDTTELSYWVEEKVDGSWALVWVKTKELNTTNGTQLYIYYGNSGAASKSNISSVWNGGYVIYFDDFEGDTIGGNPSGWTVIEGGGDGIVSVNGTIAYSGSRSVFMNDNTNGAGSFPSIYKQFTGVTGITEMVAYVYLIAMPVMRINSGEGVTTNGYPTTEAGHEMLGSSNQVQIVDPTGVVTTNCTYSLDTWNKMKMRHDFSTSKVKYWFGLDYCGEYDFRSTPSTIDTTTIQGGSTETGKWLVDAVRFVKRVEPEPTHSIGAESSISNYIQFSPTSPHIYQDVNASLLNATDEFVQASWYLWDFGDGNTTNITLPYVVHSWDHGGTYNVSVEYPNGTGTDVTYSSIYVFEPTLTFYLNDTDTGSLLTGFDIIFSQAGTNATYSATGNNVTLDATDLGMFGNVTVLPLKPFYNTTSTVINVTYDSDITLVMNATTAKIVVSPVDFGYPEVLVPVTVTVTNSSMVVEQVSDFEQVSSIDIGGNEPVSDDEDYLSSPGQMWKYYIYVNDGTTDDVCRSNLYICDEDGSNCQLVRSFDSVPGTGTDSETGYFYLKKDGTYKVLNSSGVSIDTGSYSYFPGRIYTDVVAHAAGAGEYCYAKAKVWEVTRFFQFFSSNFSLGNVTVQVEQTSDGMFGYLENTYSSQNLAYYTDAYSVVNTTAYMVPVSSTYKVKVVVRDDSGNNLQGALVKVYYLSDDGELVEISSAFTDGFGSTGYFNLDAFSTVYIVATYGDLSSGLYKKYVDTDDEQVVITLSEEVVVDVLELPFGNVQVDIYPDDVTLSELTAYWFNISVIDSMSQLANGSVCLVSSDLNISNCSSYTSPAGFFWSYHLPAQDINTSATIELSLNLTRLFEGEYVVYKTTRTYTMLERSGLSALPEIVGDLGNFGALISGILLAIAVVVFGELGLIAMSIVLYLVRMIPIVVLILALVLGLAVRYGVIM